MTLLPALATYLEGLGIAGPFPLGQVTDGTATKWTLLQLATPADNDNTRTHLFPTVQITFCRDTQGSAHSAAWTAYRALNRMGRLALTGSLTVTRSECPSQPFPLGRDASSKRWRYSLDVNFALPYSAAI